MINSFYFSHDFNARNDPKIKRLFMRHGVCGYGLFWAIIEDLYQNANALPTDYESIAFDLRSDCETVKSVINDFGLFVITENIFYSDSVQKRLDARNEKIEKAKKSAQARWGDKTKDETSDSIANASDSDANAMLLKERKEKERKEKEIKKKSEKSEISKNEISSLLSENEFIKSESEKKDLEIQALKDQLEKKIKEKSSAKKESLVYDFPEDFSQELKDLFMSFVDLRNSTKATAIKTQLQINLLIGKLIPFQESVRKVAIENAIIAKWSSFFPKPEERSNFVFNNHDKTTANKDPNATQQPDKYQIANQNMKDKLRASMTP